GIRDPLVTGVQTCALPICRAGGSAPADHRRDRESRVAAAVPSPKLAWGRLRASDPPRGSERISDRQAARLQRNRACRLAFLAPVPRDWACRPACAELRQSDSSPIERRPETTSQIKTDPSR